VPRASLVILLGNLEQLSSAGLGPIGVAVIFGVDELMDMGRTCVNLIGNCLATVVVARWRASSMTSARGFLERLRKWNSICNRGRWRLRRRQEMSNWRERWKAFRVPIDPEKQALLRARWESLPNELRTPNQLAGRHLTHCGFITGASYCSFHCTHCYLPKNANDVPIPPFAEMKEQIEANRHFQGPGGGLQITGGDVADAYWRAGRQKELIEIVRHANRVGLVPMVMTHGQTLLEHPEFLEALVVDGGLRQIAIHIDMTQAGRHGYPINRLTSESDLHPVRKPSLSWPLTCENEPAYHSNWRTTVP
jgi:hypothetical protein